jgi:putative IMPACT (imprinted ancient) family translation regulator
VLQGSGLGDVAVVVTRYFGGTRLGTGGLVRAYGDAVREVLAVLPRAVKVPTHVAQVVTPYSGFERLRRLIAAHGGEILDEDFGIEVAVRARFAVDRFSAFEVALRETFNGTLAAQIMVRDEIAIVPL